jgi:hemerythrin-like domain-containing protein
MSDDPLAGVESCHERIEERLARLENLGAHLATRGPDGIAKSTARDVLRYFEGEGARHHADEDGDLFPLLRTRAAALGRSEIAAAIDELEREHGVMERQWQRLRHKLDAIGAGASPAFDEDEIARFAWIYRRHIDRETQLVVPFAREVLTPEERAELSARMAARHPA